MVSLLKAWWGDAATKDNDFCYGYLPRLTGSHSTFDTVLAQLDGVCTGYLLLGQNPAVGSANARMQRLGMANLDWLVVRDFSLIESATWWQNGPEIETGEMRTRRHQDGGVLPARGRAHGKGRQFHQHPADAAMAPHRGGTGRRRPQRAVVHLPPGTADPAEAGRRIRRADGRDGPADPGPHLGLPGQGAAGGARRGGRARRDQRAGLRRQTAIVLHPAQGRRLHVLRLLDLLRGVRRRGEPGRPPRARRAAELGRQRVGLGLAGEPAGAVQPRLGGPGRQAVERAQGPRLVGRRKQPLDRARRARLRRRPAAGLHPARRRDRRGRDHRHGRVHHAGRRQGVAVRPGRHGRRAAARALRAAGVPVRQPALRPAAQPGPADHLAPAEPVPAERGRAGLRACSRTSPPPTG